MLKRVYDQNGEHLLRTEDATPECGVDFCDKCGDCLDCYVSDPCYDERIHVWVEYEDKNLDA